MKFSVGDQVIYGRARLKGQVLEAWFDGQENRYTVKTRKDVWSVPEQSLEMQKSSENSSEVSRVENTQNDDRKALKGVGA